MPAPRESPMTLIAVRNLQLKMFYNHSFKDKLCLSHLSSSQSTVRMRDTASLGSPTVCSTMTMVTSPAWGMPAAPILAAVAVMEMAKMSPMLGTTP